MPLPYRRGAERVIKYLTGRYRLGGVLPNDGYITGVAKSIHTTLDINGIGNQGAGLDLLHSYTLPANSLKNNGDYIDVRYSGSYANTEADKQVRLRIDSQLIISFGAVIDLEAAAWIAEYRIYRVSATSVLWRGLDLHGQFRMADGAIVTSPSGYFIDPRTNNATVADLNANNVVIDVHGEGTADNDVTLKTAEILITRF